MSGLGDDISPENRLEEMEKVLDDLAETSREMPILVEGTKDIAALRALDIPGEILLVNTGVSLVNLVEDLHTRGIREIVLLLDWDRTGGRLQRRLRELLDANGIRWDDRHRQALVRTVGNEARTVESLASLLGSLQRRAAR